MIDESITLPISLSPLENHLCQMLLCSIRIASFKIESDSFDDGLPKLSADVVFDCLLEAQSIGNGITVAVSYVCAAIATDYVLGVFDNPDTFVTDFTLPRMSESFNYVYRWVHRNGYKGTRHELLNAYRALNIDSKCNIPPTVAEVVRQVVSTNFVSFFDSLIEVHQAKYDILKEEHAPNAEKYLNTVPASIRSHMEIA